MSMHLTAALVAKLMHCSSVRVYDVTSRSLKSSTGSPELLDQARRNSMAMLAEQELAKESNLSLYLGYNHVPVLQHMANWKQHGVPDVVFKHERLQPELLRKGCASCKDLCACCALYTCSECPMCPTHKSETKCKCPTVMAIWQDSTTPILRRGWFIVGDVAIDVSGGVILVFDANELPHGLYLPDDVGRFECLSAMIVA